ncbi:LDLR chaperone MESD [Biomphalaria pfeifferi]|uniref:LDLR chaperone MESD n=1 Tax=Biomphalaria pfeifferi TaxID=112525 RepID=A0AAD8FLQ4_BIOPF|nr:LDLR chaperone MESD [Biomphalaria pfeifferi]
MQLLQLITGAKNEKNKKKDKSDASEKWKKKDIRDYNDVDIERLYEQWEEADDDELEEDELPEWKKEPPKMDLSKLDPSDPEGFIKMSKKGRTLMMFATVSGNPSEAETEKISMLWHSSLFNAHIETQRYVVGSNRVLFMLTDGAKAWEIRDFLVKQDRCEEVSIEGQTYPGAGATKTGKEDSKNTKTKSKTTKKNEEL